ncbi:MAG: hypothetical protein KC620_16580, partial [Myxococcales bacterium]|nr:hypothetical protein [Myxococcales bacterium]
MADPQTPAPPAPPPDLLPDLQARVDLVARRLDLIERRVAAFENALNTLEKQAATDDAPTPETESVARFDDLEARVQRIERR